MRKYRSIRSVEELLQLSEEEQSEVDIGEFNLRTATNLPGSEGLDVDAGCEKLDDWAKKVRRGTEKFYPNFLARPHESQHSYAQFRIRAMVTVLQLDLGVRYNPECMTGPYDARDSRNQFIHGLLSGHGGTCTSMPVLYAAIGRRLGYPLKFRFAKSHVFLRWDGDDQFNIEATQRGFEPYPDEHYLEWPFPITENEMSKGHYLTNLTARQEAAFCFAQRGHVLLDNLLTSRAIAAFNCAHDLDDHYWGVWAIASIIQDTLRNLWDANIRGTPTPEQIKRAAPTAYAEKFGKMGRNATEQAIQHAARIFGIPKRKYTNLTNNGGENLWFTIQL
jgi:hypothetical protein